MLKPTFFRRQENPPLERQKQHFLNLLYKQLFTRYGVPYEILEALSVRLHSSERALRGNEDPLDQWILGHPFLNDPRVRVQVRNKIDRLRKDHANIGLGVFDNRRWRSITQKINSFRERINEINRLRFAPCRLDDANALEERQGLLEELSRIRRELTLWEISLELLRIGRFEQRVLEAESAGNKEEAKRMRESLKRARQRMKKLMERPEFQRMVQELRETSLPSS